MPLQTPVNMKSMRVVTDELDTSLQAAVDAAEAYLGDSDGSRGLDSAIAELHQLAGILRIIELFGAVELTVALLKLLQAVQGGKREAGPEVIDAIGRGLLYLPRYLDKVRASQMAMPLVLLESTNQLRALLHEPLLWEAQVAGYQFSGDSDTAGAEAGGAASAARRLHHMFQTGLVAVLKGRHGRAHWRMMERALARLHREMPDAASREWWLLSRAVLQGFATGALELGIGRKRVLMGIDRSLRSIHKGRMELGEPLRTELAWLAAIADGEHELLSTARQSLMLPDAGLHDSDIVAARNRLHGPGRDALESMAVAVDEELRKVREYLEVISQGSAPPDAMTQISLILSRVADVFKVAGIGRAETLLRNGVQLLAEAERDMSLSQEDILLSIADILLLVESITSDVAAMEQARAATEEHPGDEDAGSAVGAALLRRSRRLAIGECSASVTLAKRAISGYLDSGFDPIHIDNLGTILTAVRGTLQMLGSDRAADVVRRSLKFVDDTVGNLSRQSRRQELLETLADALVSLDYYLDDLALTDQGNDELLSVAEESLAELGYPEHTGVAGVAGTSANG